HTSRLWIGLQRDLHHDDQTYREHCLSLAKALHLPITACGGVPDHASERLPLQNTLTAICQGCAVEELGADRLTNVERSLRDGGILPKLFKSDRPAESVQIAKRCTFSLDELIYQYPRELIPDGFTPDSYLQHPV
ncbi:hypothetical protein UF06_18910, partial [Vibrio sp. S234-5]